MDRWARRRAGLALAGVAGPPAIGVLGRAGAAAGASALVAALGPACEPLRDPAFIQPPPDARARSMLLAFPALDPLPLTVVATGIDDPVQINVQPGGTLVLLLFRETLAELGLNPGVVSESQILSRGESCVLTRPAAVFETQLEPEAPARWSMLRRPPEHVSRMLAPDPICRVCGGFEVLARADVAAFVRASAWLSSGAAFLALADGALLRAAPDGHTPISSCGRAYTSALPFGGDRFWMGAEGGVERIRIDEAAGRCESEQWAPLPEPAPGAWVSSMTAPPGRAQDELFVLTSTGSVFQLVEGAWTKLSRLERPDGAAPHESTNRGGIAWAGQQVLASGGSPRVRELPSQNERSLPPGREPEPEIEALTQVADLGVLAGTNDGRITQWRDAGWQLLYSANDSRELTAFGRYRSGFVAATGSGLMEFASPEDPCDDLLTIPGVGATNERRLLATDTLVLLPQLADSAHSGEIMWLVPSGGR